MSYISPLNLSLIFSILLCALGDCLVNTYQMSWFGQQIREWLLASTEGTVSVKWLSPLLLFLPLPL